MTERIKKLFHLTESKGVDVLLITSGTGIKYLTGYFYNFEIGESPFHIIPAALLASQPDRSNFIIADNDTLLEEKDHTPSSNREIYVRHNDPRLAQDYIEHFNNMIAEKNIVSEINPDDLV